MTFRVKDEHILVKCIYAPNKDMNNNNDNENESTMFLKRVFDDTNAEQFTHKVIVVDYNVALNHNADTLGYLHINNPNSRDYLTRRIDPCSLVDIWRLKNPNSRQYTFNKKQTKNYTRARLDYFIISKNTTKIISKVGMDHVFNLSDHRPILLHMSFSRVQKGKGFWMFNNALLNDFEFIQGCNDVIKKNYIAIFWTIRT